MVTTDAGTSGFDLDGQVAEWRDYVSRHAAISVGDADELEGHLRDQIADLERGGLSDDEAFLVAVKRLGNVDVISREFAREHSDRLWKQLVLTGAPERESTSTRRRDLWGALAFAAMAAIAIKVPELFGQHIEDGGDFYPRNLGLFAFAPLAAYFAWQRRMTLSAVLGLVVVPLVVAAVAVNVYPFASDGTTLVLAAIHLPLVVWFVVGLAYVDGRWRDHDDRMDFVRFTGEWIVYYALIALGGAVLVALLAAGLSMLDYDDASAFLAEWVLACGAVGAVVVAAWLVEAKQSVVENMAPVLTRVFTPITAVMLVVFLIGLLLSSQPATAERDLLIVVNVLLVLVLGLILYAISAREVLAPADWFDRLQLFLLLVALAVDAVMLTVMATRIADGGLTANKVAAVGLNLVLLVNLAWSAWLNWRFVRGRTPFATVERWQTTYLPVFAVWAAVVVVVVPVTFSFA